MRQTEDWASTVLRDLGMDPNDARTNVHVGLLEGRLVLTGVVDSVAMREAAGRAAARIAGQLPGAPEVENDLTVAAPREASDRALQQKVNEALAALPDLAPDAIGARVERGIAFLVGHVLNAAQVELAIEAAQGVPGLKDVVSQVQIVTGRPLDPIGLVNRVSQALALELGASALRVHVESDPEGVVTLSGEVESEGKSERAEQTARGVRGVHRVKNEIRTKRV